MGEVSGFIAKSTNSTGNMISDPHCSLILTLFLDLTMAC